MGTIESLVSVPTAGQFKNSPDELQLSEEKRKARKITFKRIEGMKSEFPEKSNTYRMDNLFDGRRNTIERSDSKKYKRSSSKSNDCGSQG